jgi:hypothetical protein
MTPQDITTARKHMAEEQAARPLAALVDAIEAYEAQGWPTGKIPGG